MNSINKSMSIWLNELKKYRVASYEELPDIDLYMDQVITYLDRQTGVFQISSLDKQITSSMINNYVKGNVILAPIKKKYSKEHLSLILEISALKQVLSINQIKDLLDTQYKDDKIQAFNDFKLIEENSIEKTTTEVLERINKIKENNLSSLNNLALELAIDAQINLAISERILFFINRLNQENLEKSKKAENETKEVKEKAVKSLDKSSKNKTDKNNIENQTKQD